MKGRNPENPLPEEKWPVESGNSKYWELENFCRLISLI